VSLFSILSGARDGLIAHSAGTAVAGQNVAGSTSPQYARRRAQLESSATGGVRVTGIGRSASPMISTRLDEQTALLAAATAREIPLNAVQAALAPQGEDLAARISKVFGAFSELAQHPSDAGVRTATLGAAESLADMFRSTAGSLDRTSSELLQQASTVASEVNERVDRLAVLQAQIERASADGSAPNDLLDRRDVLVREIAERVGARTIEDERGRLTLFGAGTVLLNEGRPSKLEVDVDAAGALRVQVRSGDVAMDVTSHVNTGTLGGVRIARDVDLRSSQSDLDALARDFSNSFNALHSAGFGADGTSGRPLFDVGAPPLGAAASFSVDAAVAGQPSRLAAAASLAELPGGGGAARAIADAASDPISATGSYAEVFAVLTSNIGSRVADAMGEISLREDSVAVALTARESASGVSVDEEMLDLTRFQRAFEATSRVIHVVDELLATLLRGT
jgi:flagellar hook-associated protein 1